MRAHLAQNSERRSLAIVDYNVLEEEFRKVYGIGPRIWLVPDIVEKYQFMDLEKVDQDRPPGVRSGRPYTGINEFLIWGSVLCDPIAVLSYEDALQLCEVLNKLKESEAVVDYSTGTVVGQCLRSIPYMYKAVVSYQLIRAFEINGYRKARDSIYLERFWEGVEASSPDPSDSTSPPEDFDVQPNRETKRVPTTIEAPPKAPWFADTPSSSSLADEDSQSQEQIAEVPRPKFDIFIEELSMYAAMPTPTPPPDPTKEVHNHPILRQNESAHPTKGETEAITAVNSTTHQTEKRDRTPPEKGQAPKPRRNPTGCQPENAAISSNVIDLTLEDIQENHTSEKVVRVKDIKRLNANRIQRRHAVAETKRTTSNSSIKKVDKQQGSSHRIDFCLKTPQVNPPKGYDQTKDDEIQIIAERKCHVRHQHIRRTARTETKTVTTIRSRSVSKGIILNQRG
ncbi:hypothetical protein AYL99_04471 [Fonsecaea erecta]|uniref:Uncharacterized protein n=1 Tax=Fonsecaea erecta TaxID=1367422 RepID=A0A178ZR05_9EURO|nr:hypothetical protein AYL99_04471 [Fonsecaea erecta]OAP62268.1 hypothetical protein AYL99_04471 [Fonsecaea erecta]